MRVVSEKLIKGKRRVLIELDDNEKLLVINENGHYKLGYPMDEIIAGHIIKEMMPVVWCSIQQEWIA